MRLLSDDELAGVIAHELSQCGPSRHSDLGDRRDSGGGALMVLVRIFAWGAMVFGGSRDRNGGGLEVLLMLGLLAPLAAMLIQMAISRSREYSADAAGARLAGNPLSLANALRKLDRGSDRVPMDAQPATAHMFIVNPLRGQSFASLFSTHPAAGAADRPPRSDGARRGSTEDGSQDRHDGRRTSAVEAKLLDQRLGLCQRRTTNTLYRRGGRRTHGPSFLTSAPTPAANGGISQSSPSACGIPKPGDGERRRPLAGRQCSDGRRPWASAPRLATRAASGAEGNGFSLSAGTNRENQSRQTLADGDAGHLPRPLPPTSPTRARLIGSFPTPSRPTATRRRRLRGASCRTS